MVACGPEPSTQRYSGLVQEFFKNVCSSHDQGGVNLPVERAQKESLCGLRGLSVPGGFVTIDEPKPECMSAVVGGLANDSVTRIVNKRFMRQPVGEEMVNILGGGKETMSTAGAAGVGTEVKSLLG